MISETISSGAEAPAVKPMTPCNGSVSSSTELMRRTRGQPSSFANLASATVFEELADPTTIIVSTLDAISMSAD